MSVCCLTSVSFSALAQNRPVVIRDTEIETMLQRWSEPIFEASGVSQNGVKIILLQNDDVNAFVAGGANIFLYTGLIQKTETPDELLGVIAHEIGHIAGGHLIKTRDALERASYESIIGTIFGIGAAIASGDAGAAAAVSGGSLGIAQRRFLAYSRINESSADQAALTYFERAGLNPEGLGSFLEKLSDQEILSTDRQSEYVRTHPLTRNRIDSVIARAEQSEHYGSRLPESWYDDHARMRAKLLGFITPEQVEWVYDDRDQSIPAQYARTIAAYRLENMDTALSGINLLIEQEPENQYFYELKGQMLADFGRPKDALDPYQKSIALAPINSGLVRIAYAQTLMNTSDSEETQRIASEELERALQDEPRSSRAHRLLATAYGRLGREGLAQLHLAEEALLQRRYADSKRQAKAALAMFEEGSRESIKARDILAFIENQKRLEDG